MTYNDLDQEEKQILADYEADQFETLTDSALEIQRLQAIAKETLQKTKNINIRLSSADLHKLKVMAVQVGIPYQTLISAILHQLANKKKELSLV